MGEQSFSKRGQLSTERLALVSRYLGEETGSGGTASSGSLVDAPVAEHRSKPEPALGAATGMGRPGIPLERWHESSFAFTTRWTRLTGQRLRLAGTKTRRPFALGMVAALLGYLAVHL